MEIPDPWPIAGLVLRTPRLELRPDDDGGVRELVEEAYLGVHPPDQQPFFFPWTDSAPADMGRESMQFYWAKRAAFAPQDWTLNFVVRAEGRVIGTQGVGAKQFAITREVLTGSWIGMRHQRRGYATEMRAAVLMLAFDHLGAVAARSEAFTDNHASNAVSRKLGYRPDGTASLVRRGAAATMGRLLVDPSTFARPDWTVRVEGLPPCLGLLGAG